MRARCLSAAIILLSSFAAGAGTLKEDLEHDGLLPTFVRPEHGAKACWARTYGAEHMAGLPDQKVAAMSLSLQFKREASRWSDERNMYNYHLDVRFRDGRKARALGNCLPEGDKGIWCGVECDGGSVDVYHAEEGAIVVDLEASGFIRLQYCGEDAERIVLRPGTADRQFRLLPLPEAECPEVEIPDMEANAD